MPAILLWNDDWNLAGPPRTLGEGSWEIVRDRRSAALADAIVFHIPTLDAASLPDGRRPGQRWVAWSMESEANYPELGDPAFMAPFDLTMTYRRDADVWVPYLPSLDDLRRPPEAKIEAAPAVYIASNQRDRSGRDAYVGELMRHLAVDAYGACRRNRTLENDDGRGAKLRTIARYRFTLAFENSIAKDYVTEKFYDALVAGSVPVVLGAPNTRDFAPADRCYIDTSDFDGPAALAAYLEGLVEDESAYAAHLAWKRAGVGQAFLAMLDIAGVDPWVRLARRLTAT
ncbi:MAG TPA: glycosyltransferase family 10 [Casimicrobiaceae bacterium]|nr:glycosyltransferase family 10 [Casimicrobiaceae bacterium]